MHISKFIDYLNLSQRYSPAPKAPVEKVKANSEEVVNGRQENIETQELLDTGIFCEANTNIFFCVMPGSVK